MKKLLLIVLLLPLNAVALQVKNCDLYYYTLDGEYIVGDQNGAIVNDFGTSFQIIFDNDVITSPELKDFKAKGFYKSKQEDEYVVETPEHQIYLTNCKKVKS
jgi:hypothetical protein